MKGQTIYANFIILITIILMGFGFCIEIGSIVPVSLSKLTTPTIIIDAGHGGMDGGAVGVNGIAEKHINLAIAQKLKTMLILGGYDVVMTRDSDVSIHDEGTVGVRNQKISDMNNRLKIMKDTPGAIFISIHQNQFRASQFHGAQVFYSTNSESSRELAQMLQNKIKDNLDSENNREIKPADDGLFLLKYAPTTAIIAECGFLSNAAEAEKLTSESYQNELVFVIYSTVMDFTSTAVKKTGET